MVNKPGAGGEIGFTTLATSKPDGYTIGFINVPAIIAYSIERETRYKMAKLFDTKKRVYCLILEGEYNKYIAGPGKYEIDIVREDYISRKRLRLDKGFLMALLSLDRDRIHDYLMEKVLLIRKDENA